jgi:hypothetical protein
MTTSSTDSWEKEFQKCVNFHGHACPGLAMGYVAARAAMAWLGERRAEDEEIIAIVETDAYAVGKMLYPKAYADIDPKKKADEIFRFFVGVPVNDRMEKDFGILGRQLVLPAR